MRSEAADIATAEALDLNTTAEMAMANCLRNCAHLSGKELFDALAPGLCRGDLAIGWLTGLLSRLAAGGTGLPRSYCDPVLQSLVLLDDGRAQLSLAMVCATGWRRQRASRAEHREIVGFADGWSRIVFLSAPDAMVEQFVLQDGKAQGRPRCRVDAGAYVDLDNALQSLRFAHLGADLVMLRLLVRDPAAGEAVECDVRTGEILRIRQAQSRDGRAQMIVSLLRSLGRQDAVPVIVDQVDSWPPHLRWHGAREAVAMDSAAGMDLLALMAVSDPDATLREQADSTHRALLARYPMLARTG